MSLDTIPHITSDKLETEAVMKVVRDMAKKERKKAEKKDNRNKKGEFFEEEGRGTKNMALVLYYLSLCGRLLHSYFVISDAYAMQNLTLEEKNSTILLL